MVETPEIAELRRLISSRERRLVRPVPGGVRFSLGDRVCFLADDTVLRVLSEEEPARQMRQRINLAVRRLVG